MNVYYVQYNLLAFGYIYRPTLWNEIVVLIYGGAK
jgi:hypothetical protein